MQIAILEDSADYRKTIREYIAQYQKEHEYELCLTEYSSGSDFMVNAKNHWVYHKPPAGCSRKHHGILPLCGVHPARETNQNASVFSFPIFIKMLGSQSHACMKKHDLETRKNSSL